MGTGGQHTVLGAGNTAPHPQTASPTDHDHTSGSDHDHNPTRASVPVSAHCITSNRTTAGSHCCCNALLVHNKCYNILTVI